MIDSCNQLTLAAFIRCTCYDDYSVLGEGTPEQLSDAWRKIWEEYCILSEQKVYKSMLKMLKQIGGLGGKKLCLELCLQVLKEERNQECIDNLKSYGYPQKFETYGTEQYLKDWKNVNSGLKSTTMNLQIQSKKYQDFMAKNSQSKQSNESDMLMSFSAVLKGQMWSLNSTTVAEYCGALRLFELQNQRNNVRR